MASFLRKVVSYADVDGARTCILSCGHVHREFAIRRRFADNSSTLRPDPVRRQCNVCRRQAFANRIVRIDVELGSE